MARVRKPVSDATPRLDFLLEQQALLFRLAREIGPADSLEPVLRTVLHGMRSLVDFRGGTICLVDDQGVYVAAADPPVSEEVASARVPIGTGLAGRCVATGEPVVSDDITADERVNQRLAATGSNRGMRSYLAVPLVCLGEVIGLLQVDSEQPGAFDTDDLRFLEGLATHVAGAIESARRFEQMRRLDDARSVFIARVSHELRTPLTILRGFTSLLVDDPERYGIGKTPLEMLRGVDAAGARLEALVEELITVSTLETGLLLVPRPESVPLLNVLRVVRAESVAPELIAVSCPPDLEANVDPTLLRQALNTLTQNAIAYAGGAELVAEANGADGRTVRVVDHGPGIPDENKQAVFERFHRGDHAGPGWGLGLSVARELATALGTKIVLTDTPGGGATFSMLLQAS